MTEAAKRYGWLHAGAGREPYRVEGKKTMGLEVVEQLGWQVPDAILYPTGGGVGIIGMWKVFDELEELGWIGSAAAAARLRAGPGRRRGQGVPRGRSTSAWARSTWTRSRPASWW